MKQLIASFIILASIINIAYAQNTVLSKDVPAAVRQNMSKMYPSASSLEWKQDVPGFVAVDFTNDKKKMSATFDGNGGWVSTNTYFEKEAYPQPVVDYINSSFSGAKIKACSISETVKEKTYECRIKYNGEQYELVFGIDGKFRMKSKVED